ncbi:hypothetical protein Baya_9360 [Bagarius yarrelli]|uniref:Uncharacterized protein n=1 Tax=Bagarius yarrelli TaxID=175774 RepID=A0A556U669_BAGYA|nr:hypothetical protein Baya_9360 [Bagarius yarrelli]
MASGNSGQENASLVYRAFFYKISTEYEYPLRGVYNVGVCLVVALVLVLVGVILVSMCCGRSREKRKPSKLVPPKRSQTVYSSMLPPREDTVVNMDVFTVSAQTQTLGQDVGVQTAGQSVSVQTPEPQRKVRNKRIKIHAGDIRRSYKAKRLKAKQFAKATT